MKPTRTESFYAGSLKILNQTRIPFAIGGTYAVNVYVGMERPTKDLDIFCKAGDYPKILKKFSDLGYKTQITDERWLVKIINHQSFLDIIYSSANGVAPVTDEWLRESQAAKLFGMQVKLLHPTELIWSKVFVQERNKYDGNDVAHLILTRYKDINWRKLLSYMDQYWEVLLAHVLNFRFIYPSQRELLPKWLLNELLSRLKNQINLPTSKMKVCRGRLYSSNDFAIDVQKWGFEDITGWQHEHKK